MEALILYFVIFFPSVYASPSPDWLVNGIQAARVIPFSVLRELGRLLTYTLPSLALLLYLIYRAKPRGAATEPVSLLKAAAPTRRDALPFVIGLPGLIIIGLFVSFLVSRFAPIAAPFRVEGPSSLYGWIVMILLCLGTGYLEELYFRYYLLSKLEKIVASPALRVAFSTLLFALCHAHDGLWGVLNAALAGVFLSALFLRYRSIHGIALAHAGYNVFVYAMGTVGN